MTAPLLELNDGHQMPALGFGTYTIDDPSPHLGEAIDAGYRLLDTATRYDNEAEVGEAVRASSVPRDELFVTSKLPGADHGFDEALRSVEGSLERLGLDRSRPVPHPLAAATHRHVRRRRGRRSSACARRAP